MLHGVLLRVWTGRVSFHVKTPIYVVSRSQMLVFGVAQGQNRGDGVIGILWTPILTFQHGRIWISHVILSFEVPSGVGLSSSMIAPIRDIRNGFQRIVPRPYEVLVCPNPIYASLHTPS
jgi:hypothetical protein